MCGSTHSTSSPTLRTGRRSDTGRLLFGLLIFAGKELVAAILVLVGASLLLFAVLKAAPADSVKTLRLQSEVTVAHGAEEGGSGFIIESGKEYLHWLGGASTGRFGISESLQKGRHASELIWPAVARSFSLLIMGLLISVLLALGAAIARNIYGHSYFVRVLSSTIGIFSAIPVFLYVYGAVAGGNRLIAAGAQAGWWTPPHWFPLPVEPAFAPWIVAALILAVGDGGLVDLFQRFSGELRTALKGEHLTGVRMLGLSLPEVVARDFIPGTLSHISRRISFFLGSLVVVESALGWPGVGYLAWRAAAERDMAVLLGAAFIMSVLLKVVGMGCDFAGYMADPRRRVGG